MERILRNLSMGKLEQGYIYESPDGGKTVYRRNFGQYESKDLL